MTGDELAAALREKGWETVTVETFSDWLRDEPELLAANREDPDTTIRIKVGKGPAQAMCAVTALMLDVMEVEVLVNVLHNKLRQAWADAVWEGA